VRISPASAAHLQLMAAGARAADDRGARLLRGTPGRLAHAVDKPEIDRFPVDLIRTP
jgi:hypothetical protein